jgi:hypothetical protein
MEKVIVYHAVAESFDSAVDQTKKQLVDIHLRAYRSDNVNYRICLRSVEIDVNPWRDLTNIKVYIFDCYPMF